MKLTTLLGLCSCLLEKMWVVLRPIRVVSAQVLSIGDEVNQRFSPLSEKSVVSTKELVEDKTNWTLATIALTGWVLF